MNLYLVENIVGFFVLDDDGKILSKRLYSASLKKVEIAKYILNFSLGDISPEIVNILKDLFSELNLGNKTLVVEDVSLGSKIRNMFSNESYEVVIENPSKGGIMFRRNLSHYLVNKEVRGADKSRANASFRRSNIIQNRN